MAVKKPRRLSRSVRPLFYRLRLIPNFETLDSFEGTLDLTVHIEKPTTHIVLNQVDLEIKTAFVKEHGKIFSAKPIEYDKKRQRLVLHFPHELSGVVTLFVHYSGPIADDLRGLYRSSYKDASGHEHYLLTTQCEATDARKIFPCFDEPSFKAPIELTVVAPANKTVVANMNFAVRDFYKGKQKVEFVRTPPMSTHIFALAVGDLEYLEGGVDGVEMRLYTVPGRSAQGQFALDFAVFTLHYLNEYFGIPYPLRKLDLLAIPDFAAGAMENWGAITFRESLLLVDERSTIATRQHVAEVIAHEIVHMWFGNLVTPDWWDDLWLKEAFATFVAHMVVDSRYPEWRIWEDFISSTYGAALAKDGLHSTHPIQVPTYVEDDIGQNYDAISYDKGGSVLRQNLGHIGDRSFREGVQTYLKEHAYGNAKTLDLWDAFEKASGEPVRRVMRSFTEQSGYPVIKVERVAKRILRLEQSRFLYGASTAKDEAMLWHIPITITDAHDSSQSAQFVMSRRVRRITLPEGISTPVFNPDISGFYRVNYSAELLSALRECIAYKTLSALLRASILSDSFALSLNGAKPLGEFMNLLMACGDEQEYVVWSKLLGALTAIECFVEDDADLNEKLYVFERQLLRPAFDRLGWEVSQDESTQQRMLRTAIIGCLGYCKDRDIVNYAQKLFGLGQDLHPDLRGVIYRIVVHSGGGYDALVDKYTATDMSALKVEILRALAAPQDAEHLRHTIDFAFSNDVRMQDAYIGVARVASNTPLGPGLVWEYLQNNWDKVHKRFGEGGMRTMGDFVAPAIANTRSFAQLQNIRTFLQEHPLPTATRDIEEAFERAELNILWRERLMPELKQHFDPIS